MPVKQDLIVRTQLFACRFGEPEELRALLVAKADVNTVGWCDSFAHSVWYVTPTLPIADKWGGSTPLHYGWTLIKYNI